MSKREKEGGSGGERVERSFDAKRKEAETQHNKKENNHRNQTIWQSVRSNVVPWNTPKWGLDAPGDLHDV